MQIKHRGALNYTQETVVSNRSNHALQQNAAGSITPASVDDGTWFDQSGNQRTLLPDRLQPLSWSDRNRLSRVTLVLRNGLLDDHETYQYGADGTRVRKQTRIQTAGTVRTVEAIYLPGLTLRVTKSAEGRTVKVVEALQEVNTHAGHTHARTLHWEAEERIDDQMRYGIGNLIDSIGLEMDHEAALINREEYYPYGGTSVWAARSQVEADTKYVRYSGKERDTTGLYDYGWRSYQPWLGRWLNPDPAGTIDGLNLYWMVKNNPICFRDMDGRVKELSQAINSLRLEKGHISVLSDKGLLVGSGETETDLDFMVHRYDSVGTMDAAIPFKNDLVKKGGDFYGVISIFNGDQVTSTEAGSGTIGTYWGNHSLDSSITGINVVNGMSGTVGIRIPLVNVQPNRPIIITSGALSGCTMIYTVDDENFYALHTGQKPGDDDWKTGREGVVSTFESYRSLSGKPIAPIVNEHNNTLVELFSDNIATSISYLGKTGTRIETEHERVKLFDYNKATGPTPRAGYSYALLARTEGHIKIKTISEDVSIKNGRIAKLASLKARLA
ncbi:cytotoxic necrotizing factor Rho-activating domain-containing protein [Burkholderia ubonensis]|uniref:cytotoxic necrotizing factor Rho-activating domain-containing protein n=1 Tax=Burkholderia ubonensis TaxID=101571 RepID=UPI0009B32C9A|nr:cytotoxic necrotizing factor Rho-activating domain-containing protein [Burkholderia ubonensis]